MLVLLNIACYLLVVSLSDAARILAVFPVPSISHQVVFRPLTQELAKRGHEVVVITPDPVFKPQETPANLTEINVHDISYNIWKETIEMRSKGSKGDIATLYEIMLTALVSVFDAQLKNKNVRKILHDKDRKFDLVLTEACMRPGLVYSHIYKAPAIQVSSFGSLIDNYLTVGAPVHPLLYPSITRQKLNNLTIWDKFSELYTEYVVYKVFENNKRLEDNLLTKHFGKSVPTISELENNIHMLFLNVHPIFEGIRPVPPTVVYMGGLHQKPNKELPLDLKSYLDSSKNGVIYVSFGTNVDPTLFSSETVQTLVLAFSSVPYDVLWKWNKDELPGRTPNIRISKWLPQSDLLKHPKIKLFITQGGLQSTDEAITAGVPLIGIPMIGDQWFNVEKYVHHQIGINLHLETITAETLIKNINTVILDDSYRRNIVQLRKYMLDEPMRPLDRAVWWIEYVLRHGGAKHLRAPAAKISWAEYLELELIFTLLFILFVALVLTVIVLRLLYRLVLQNSFSPKLKRS